MSTKEEIVEDAVAASHNTRSRRLIIVLTILAILGSFFTLFLGYKLYSELHSGAQQGVDLAAQVKQACKQQGHQTPQIRRLCNDATSVIQEAPVEPSSPGPSGAAGLPGPGGPGPSNSQVALAVANFCASGNCQGPGPSASQVAQAVTLFCNQNGECRGPTGAVGPGGAPGKDATGAPGAPGAQGAPGADSTVPGPQGPPPTDQQIADAVSNYCSNHGNCQGPKGDPGVVSVNSDACAPQDGQVIASVGATYDANAQRITLSCTYANAVTLPGNSGRN